MSKSLVITEKPTVAKDIAKALGGFTENKEYLESDLFVISWAVGHLVEFITPEEIDPKYRAWILEDLPIIPDKFAFKAKEKCSSRLAQLKKLMARKDVDCLINACDAGREGELIFREIVDFCKSKKPCKRLWLQSMTPEAIRQGFASLKDGTEYDRLGDAAKCRSEADWLIGINATRAFTKRMKTRQEKNSWSAGRVQTPTLAMLTDRELEILAFRPTPFWRLTGTFSAPLEDNPHTYEGVWYNPKFKADPDRPQKDDWITDKEELDKIMAACRGQQGKAWETRKQNKESAPPLFDLTTLQREANKRFGMSAKSTLAAAQKLYESYKLITYPRTSSKCLPSDYVKPVHDILNFLTGYASRAAEGLLDFPAYAQAAQTLNSKGLENQKRIFNDAGVSDHFALIPTLTRAPRTLRDDEAKIYNLIMRRFLAAFFPPAIWTKIERTTEIAGQFFRTTGRSLTVPGWLGVYGRDAENEKDCKLPALAPKEKTKVQAQCENLKEKAEETKPPARITEGRLLSLMENAGKAVEDENLSQILENKGLGTPATRAEIIEALVLRGYADKTDHGLRATTKGIMLIDMLRRIKTERLTSPALTGEMESHLFEVEEGKRRRQAYMDEVKDYTHDIIDKARGFDYGLLYSEDPPVGPCPLCGKAVREHMRFYACEDNSGKEGTGCKFIIWKDKSGRYLDRKTISELLTEGKTPVIEGFPGSSRSTYKTSLHLSADKTAVEAEGETSVSDLPADGEAVGKCPFHDDCKVIETPTHYRCTQACVENGVHKSGFILPRIVCKRPITREELKVYLENGKSELLENFTSQYGRPFKGYLVMKPTGKHGFEFPPRASKKTTDASAEAGSEKDAETKTAAKTGARSKTAATAKTAAAKTAKSATVKTAAKKTAAKTSATKTASKKTAATAKTAAEKPAVKKTASKRALKDAEALATELGADPPKKRIAKKKVSE